MQLRWNTDPWICCNLGYCCIGWTLWLDTCQFRWHKTLLLLQWSPWVSQHMAMWSRCKRLKNHISCSTIIHTSLACWGCTVWSRLHHGMDTRFHRWQVMARETSILHFAHSFFRTVLSFMHICHFSMTVVCWLIIKCNELADKMKSIPWHGSGKNVMWTFMKQ